MVKNGTQSHQNVNVNPDTIGMVNTVQNHSNAPMVEYGIYNISNVFALMALTGVDLIARLLKNVSEDSILILLSASVYASLDSSGTERCAFNAITEEYGMLLHYHAPALLVLSLFLMDADSNNSAQEVKSGVKIHGLANAR